jgi:hypothetical protein|tara:strand:- start:258 stop:662 length:405 start_codon:yes stop_codon:yes gene_type:complete
MSKEDLDYIVRVEKAIRQKYGEEAIQNPRAKWSEEKEREYLEQIKKIHKKQRKVEEARDKVEVDGFLISKKLLSKDSERICPVCETYSFDKKDDLYMNKYDCCFKCYVEWVESREERWESGWRPEKIETSKRNW